MSAPVAQIWEGDNLAALVIPMAAPPKRTTATTSLLHAAITAEALACYDDRVSCRSVPGRARLMGSSAGNYVQQMGVTMQGSSAANAATRLEGFAEFVRSTMTTWKVPGMAVAIVKDGEVVFSQGFGLRDVQGTAAVTPRTLFAIGSCTKAFTTMGMAILVDEGKLDWDTSPSPQLRLEPATSKTAPRDTNFVSLSDRGSRALRSLLALVRVLRLALLGAPERLDELLGPGFKLLIGTIYWRPGIDPARLRLIGRLG